MPLDRFIMAAVTDAIADLTYPENWEDNGAVSADDLAQMMSQTLSIYLKSTGNCMIGKVEFFPDVVPPTHLLLDGSTYPAADYPMLWDSPQLPAAWKNTGTDEIELPDYMGRYLLSGSGVGGRDDFTVDESNISFTPISYTGAFPTAITIGAGVPAPSAIPSPMFTSIGSLVPSGIDLDPVYFGLKPAIFATYG